MLPPSRFRCPSIGACPVAHRNCSAFPLTTSRILELDKEDQVAEAPSDGKVTTRTRYFSTKAKRVEKRKSRRNDAPKNVLEHGFRAWSYQEMKEHKARIAGLEWKIEVAVILERTPIIRKLSLKNSKRIFLSLARNLQSNLSLLHLQMRIFGVGAASSFPFAVEIPSQSV
jgi:hypothetical protein